MRIEKSEMKSQERNRERKFLRGSSSSGKRTRESQVNLIHGSTTRGRRQGPTMAEGFGRGISIGQDERPECLHYHKNHFGTYRRVTGGCFRYVSTYHLIANYPQGSRSSKNPQGSSRGESNVPPPTSARGRR